MKVKTYLFGEVAVDPEKVIVFPEGLAAFEDNKRFMLIHETDDSEPSTFALQSLDDPGVAFQVVDPQSIGFSYELQLTDEEMALLKNPSEQDVAVMLLLYKRDKDSSEGIGANIRAPIIVNAKERLAIQKSIVKPRTSITISNLSSAV
jgi:flagellar assembly factor FliW